MRPLLFSPFCSICRGILKLLKFHFFSTRKWIVLVPGTHPTCHMHIMCVWLHLEISPVAFPLLLTLRQCVWTSVTNTSPLVLCSQGPRSTRQSWGPQKCIWLPVVCVYFPFKFLESSLFGCVSILTVVQHIFYWEGYLFLKRCEVDVQACVSRWSSFGRMRVLFAFPFLSPHYFCLGKTDCSSCRPVISLT